MSNNKVYCKNCKFLCTETGFFTPTYNYIRFRNDTEWSVFGALLCKANLTTSINFVETPIQLKGNKNIIIDNPYELNCNNTCSFYKRKWWKFWVKNVKN